MVQSITRTLMFLSFYPIFFGCASSTTPASNANPTPVGCVRRMSDFIDTGRVLPGTSAPGGSIYTDQNSDQYFIKRNRWTDAYAGTVGKFLLGPHSQDVCFVLDGTNIHSAVKLNPSFQDAWTYHGASVDLATGNKLITSPLLPAGRGLGEIIVVGVLLAERDLKGLNWQNSNIGIVQVVGVDQYFRIDYEMSLRFDESAVAIIFNATPTPMLDLSELRRPLVYSNYLDHLHLSQHLSLAHRAEIHDAAVNISRVSRESLNKVLDFCEEQLRLLPVYPINDGLGGPGLFSSPIPVTYKEAILHRFDQLPRS